MSSNRCLFIINGLGFRKRCESEIVAIYETWGKFLFHLYQYPRLSVIVTLSPVTLDTSSKTFLFFFSLFSILFFSFCLSYSYSLISQSHCQKINCPMAGSITLSFRIYSVIHFKLGIIISMFLFRNYH